MDSVNARHQINSKPTDIDSIIAALPEDPVSRLLALDALLKELEGIVTTVRDEIATVTHSLVERSMNDTVIAGISDRFSLSSDYGVIKEDFDAALADINANKDALTRLCRLTATGAEMTVVSVDSSKVVLIDTVGEINVPAQKVFLTRLDARDHSDSDSDSVQNFQPYSVNGKTGMRIYDEQKMETVGVNYDDYEKICDATGAERMSAAEYAELLAHKPVDILTHSWLWTPEEDLDGGTALGGHLHGGRVVTTYTYDRYSRFHTRGGRPKLTLQRAT